MKQDGADTTGRLISVTRGTLSGLLATIPMTLVMEGLRRNLPVHERYPLPPRLIMASVTAQTGARVYLTNEQEEELAWCAHYLFGALMGAVYGAITPRTASHPFARGALFGCCVWAASYQGWLPALGILPAATHHPTRRVLLMIAAHVIWGVTLTEIDKFLSKIVIENGKPGVADREHEPQADAVESVALTVVSV
ncbi:MAG: hypothetical protein JWN70_5810 [Planctomycetaceae bacterium]|nr:hypothetical protein [Planctomycetaceae bacterium]